MSFPPDTDTPGFAEENKDKPEETRLISEAAGLYSPESVAKVLLDHSLVSFNFHVKSGAHSSLFEIGWVFILNRKENLPVQLDLKDFCSQQSA